MIGSDYRYYNAKLFTGDTLDTQSVLSKWTENSEKKGGICVQRTTVFSEKSENAPRKEQNIFHFSCFSTFTPEETR